MVLLFLKGALQLDDPASLIKTKWELSDTRNFSHIIAKSEDNQHKYAILFNIDLDPSITYYARAQCLLTTGWTNHSNLDVVEVKLSGLSGYKNSIMPSKISTPIISTNSDMNNHDVSNFIITANGFDRVGLSEHTETIFFITDLDNNVVWYKITYTDLNSIEVNNVILEDGGVYRIHAIFGSSSDDFSQIGSMTIKTDGNKNIVFKSGHDVNLGIDYKFNLEFNKDITDIHIKLSRFKETVNEVYQTTITSFEHTIPNTYFKEGIYLLQLKSNLDAVYKNVILQVH